MSDPNTPSPAVDIPAAVASLNSRVTALENVAKNPAPAPQSAAVSRCVALVDAIFGKWFGAEMAEFDLAAVAEAKKQDASTGPVSGA